MTVVTQRRLLLVGGLLLPSLGFLSSSTPRRSLRIPSYLRASPSSALLPDPAPNSIGNFFENQTESVSFIQCYMLSVGIVDGAQYGIGFPVDMPVMLTYFEGNELKPVQPDYPDYEHLITHVSTQLDSNDLQLYNTPVVLTLQGDFEDESFNQIFPGSSSETDDEELDFEDDGDREEITIADVLKLEGISDDFGLDDEDDDEDNDDDEDDVVVFHDDTVLKSTNES